MVVEDELGDLERTRGLRDRESSGLACVLAAPTTRSVSTPDPGSPIGREAIGTVCAGGNSTAAPGGPSGADGVGAGHPTYARSSEAPAACPCVTPTPGTGTEAPVVIAGGNAITLPRSAAPVAAPVAGHPTGTARTAAVPARRVDRPGRRTGRLVPAEGPAEATLESTRGLVAVAAARVRSRRLVSLWSASRPARRRARGVLCSRSARGDCPRVRHRRLLQPHVSRADSLLFAAGRGGGRWSHFRVVSRLRWQPTMRIGRSRGPARSIFMGRYEWIRCTAVDWWLRKPTGRNCDRSCTCETP